jgi:integrase
MEQFIHAPRQHVPGNKGKLVGQKAPLRLKDIWAIRVRLQIGSRTRELALFNLAIDSKLRSCDLVNLRVRDVCHGNVVAARAMVMQQKTQRPVQFEITEQTRVSLLAWIQVAGRRSDDYLFPSRLHDSPHLSTRQYARIVRGWVREIGLDSSAYGTHTMRRTKASLIYRRTKNRRVVHAALSFNKTRAVIDNSQALLAAACLRCQNEAPMLRDRIRCACLVMARCVLSANNFRAIRDQN